MASSIGGKNIATTGSAHVAPGPAPAMSLSPPTPPAGPIPAPFMYISRSKTATGTASKLKVAGKPVLVKGSHMTVEKPGNITCNPTGGDVVTHMVDKHSGMYAGAGNVKAENKAVCRTGDGCYMNIPKGSKVAQLQTVLLESAFLLMLGAGASMFAGREVGLLDPVSAASGAVFDEDVDIAVRGLVPFELRRRYHTSSCGERGSLGWGWTHCLEQWVTVDGDRARVRTSLGGDVVFDLVDDRAYHRGERLELTRDGDAYVLRSLENRFRSFYEPLAAGQRPMLRAIRDPRGIGVELTYANGQLVAAIGSSGRDLHFSYDERGLLARVELHAQGKRQLHVAYEYDDEGQLVKALDALGNATRYVYDGHRRLVTKTVPTGFSVHYAYEAEGHRCIRTWGDDGLLVGHFEYDLEKRTTAMTGNPSARVYAWDERGNVIGEYSTDGAVERQFTFDDDNLLRKYENAMGNQWIYQRNRDGLLVGFRDAEGRTTALTYRDGLCLSQSDPGGFTSHYEYDGHDSLIRVRYPSQAEVSIEYDSRGRVASVAGPDGIQGAFEYDAQDNCVVEIGPAGGRTLYTFDALGRILTRTDELGRTLRLEHDARDRIVARRFPDGSVVRQDYDALDRQTREVDPSGQVSTLRYGGTHSMLEQVHPDGSVWKFGYDKLERLSRVETPMHEAWDYLYDRAGRLVEERTFDGRSLTYQYDRGEFCRRVDRNDGSYRATTLDATGRVLVEETPDGDASYDRDELGRVIRAVVDEPYGATEVCFEYDHNGREVAEIQDGQAIRYEWTHAGQMASRALPGGETTRYEYDELGALTRVVHDNIAVAIERDASGMECRRVFERVGVSVAAELDSMDRVTGQVVASGGEQPNVLLERSYAYDPRGWLREVVDSKRGPRTFGHDSCGRLRSAVGQGVDERFDYDASGSVVGASRDGSTSSTWAVAPGGVLVLSDDGEFEYDDYCRRTALTDDSGRQEYFWDARDRLREVRFADGRRVIYVYDAYGRRVRKDYYAAVDLEGLDLEEADDPTVPVRTVRFLWEGRLLAAEVDSAKGTRIFVHEPGTFSPIMHIDDGRAFYYVHDHLRAASELVDDRGQLAWAPTRSAWGDVLDSNDAQADSPLRLLGHYHDEETGLFYARNRYFEPTTARWLSPDPLGLGGGKNPHGFEGSPVVHVDPLGLRSIIGNPAYDAYLRYAFRAAPLPGHYDVVVHGSPNSVAWKDVHGQWHGLTPQQLAARIRAQSDYTGGPVRLNACNVGRLPNGFAQQLANELGQPVVAPNRTIWAWQNGNLGVFDKAGSVDPVTGVVTPVNNPGAFVPFNPPPAPAAAPAPAAPPPAGGPTP